MKFIIKTILLITGISFSLNGKTQELTLKSAIDTAMRNNFGIQIARNNVDIAKTNNSYGNAGGLPTISANAGDNASVTSSNQKFSDGTQLTVTNIGENALNAGVSGGITLFNGFKVIATKERLTRLQNLSEIQLNQQIQNTVADIMVTYYDIIRQQNYLRIIQNSLDVSKQKLEIVQMRNNVGMADAVDILQAQTDVNSAEQALEMQKLVVEQDKSDLLLLMSSKKQSEITVSDTILVDENLQLDAIITNLEQNPQYLSAEQQIKINEQILKEVSALRYPSVKLSAGYDYYQANAKNASMIFNQNYGPNAGVNVQIPIFNGNIYKTQRDVAKINLLNANLEKQQVQNSLLTSTSKLHRSYSTTLNQIEAQKKNCEMTRKLLDVVLQQFHVNQATILDVKAAQTSFENTSYLLVNLLYSAKVAEIELKQLTYSLEY